jgi:hypothetical protein
VARGVGEGKSQEMAWSAHPRSYHSTNNTAFRFFGRINTHTFQVYAAAERKNNDVYYKSRILWIKSRYI